MFARMPSGRDSAKTPALAISPLRKTLQKPNRGTRRVHESCSRSIKELSCAAGLRFGLGLTFLPVQLAGCSGPNYFGSQSRLRIFTCSSVQRTCSGTPSQDPSAFRARLR